MFVTEAAPEPEGAFLYLVENQGIEDHFLRRLLRMMRSEPEFRIVHVYKNVGRSTALIGPTCWALTGRHRGSIS